MARTQALIAGIALLASTLAPFAYADTGHWCGQTWSNFPCTSGDYTNSGSYNTYNNYGGYTSPYQNTYYNSYPSNQYYYNNYNYGVRPLPTCALTYSTSGNNGYGYSTITLSWSAANVTTAYLTGIGPVPSSGTRTVYPNGLTTYTMTVYGAGGSSSCQTTYNPAMYQTTYSSLYPAYPYTPYQYSAYNGSYNGSYSGGYYGTPYPSY